MKYLKLFEEIYHPKYQPQSFEEFCEWIGHNFDIYGDSIVFEKVCNEADETVEIKIFKMLSKVTISEIDKLINGFENVDEWKNYYMGAEHDNEEIIFKFKFHPPYYQ